MLDGLESPLGRVFGAMHDVRARRPHQLVLSVRSREGEPERGANGERCGAQGYRVAHALAIADPSPVRIGEGPTVGPT
jgi:hypothetical protein